MNSKDIENEIIAEKCVLSKTEGGLTSVKNYNFQCPDKFSKEHIRGLFDAHKEFSHQLAISLTSYLRMQVEANVVAVDRLPYEEYINSMPKHMIFGAFDFSPLAGQGLIGLSYDVIASIVDRMLGGNGDCETKNRELTDVEEALSKKIIEKSVKVLETVWQKLTPVKCNLIKTDGDFSLIEIADKHEIVAVITIEVQLNTEKFGLINLCLPYPMLETVLGEFTNRHIYQTKGKNTTAEEKTELIDRLNPSAVDVEVVLGKTEVSINELIKLKVGDVIKLNTKTDDKLVMKISNNKKFFVKPGTVKNRICVKITDKYDETEEVLKNYL